MTQSLESAIARDVTFCAAMADELEDYLKSDTLFWEPSRRRPGGMSLPKLTVGGLLLAMRRLETLRDHLDPDQAEAFARARRELQHQGSQWRPRYQNKLQRELRSRLDTWAWYLDDCRDQGESAIAHYARQAETRVKIDLLLDAATQVDLEVDKNRQRLVDLDNRLGSFFAVGEFCWLEELTPGFAPDRFWYLYGFPRED